MIPYSSIGEIATTPLQYLAVLGVVALRCLPSLTVSDFRARLDSWLTDRFLVNYLLLLGVIALGQGVAIVAGWQVLHIGATQSDPQFREFRLIAVLVTYSIVVWALGIIVGVNVSTEAFDVTEELVSDMMRNERYRTSSLPRGG